MNLMMLGEFQPFGGSKMGEHNARKKEEKDIRIIIVKICATIFLIILMGSLIWFTTVVKPKETSTFTEITNVSNSTQQIRTTEIVQDGLIKYFDWAIIATAIGIGLLWKKELRLGSLGPFGFITQQIEGRKLEEYEDNREGILFELNGNSIEKYWGDKEQFRYSLSPSEVKVYIEHIGELFKRYRTIGITLVAHHLNIPSSKAKELLYFLVDKGLIRVDGFPRKTIFTPTGSKENLIINLIKDNLTKRYGQLLERRYVRIGKKYDVDAIFENEYVTIIIEVKIISKNVNIGILENWISRLMLSARDITDKNKLGLLAIASNHDHDGRQLKNSVENMTFEQREMPIEIIVFDECPRGTMKPILQKSDQ
jgi:predicted transcriptional regulator